MFGLGRILAVGKTVVAAREPGILVDDPAQPIAELVVGTFPQGAKGAGRGDDGVVVDAVLGTDLGDAIGHAGPAGNSVDQALGPFQHAVQDAFRPAHFPKHVHMKPAQAVGRFIGHARLMDAAADGIGNQFLMAFASGLAIVNLRQEPTFGVEGIGVDARKGAHAAAGGPGPRAFAIGDRNALATLHERPDLAA